MANEIAADVLHHERERMGTLCRGKQMHVVGHQDVGIERAPVLASAFAQTIEVEEVIFFGEEGCLSIVAALDDVLRHIDQVQT